MSRKNKQRKSKFLKVIYCPSEDKELHDFIHSKSCIGGAIREVGIDHYEDDEDDQADDEGII